jgi:hypothetical protein
MVDQFVLRRDDSLLGDLDFHLESTSPAPISLEYCEEACEARGYQANWSCESDHTASIRVAQKLGFQQMRAHQIFEYHATPGEV